MQIELLETFLDLVETRSFNRTAERLGVTQSTVSARVVTLEQAVGARLFVRSRAGTELSTEGLRFEPHARMLRTDWTEAKRAVAPSGNSAVTLRLGIQNDLAPGHIGKLVAGVKRNLPQVALYIEPDYSAQMCADLMRGALDFAILYSPKPHPDLHFASVGEISYRLISSAARTRDQIDPTTYIRGAFSPAFEESHRQMLPELLGAPLAAGQSGIIASLLSTIGGTGFVLAETALGMVDSEQFGFVEDVTEVTQPIYAAMNLRNRTARIYRRTYRIAHKHFTALGSREDRD